MFYRNGSFVRKLILLRLLAGGTPAATLTVTGVSPLALVNSLAHSIKSLTQYGKCEQRNLPQGYTELDYIQSDGNQYIDLNTALNQDDVIEIEFEIQGTQSGTNIFGYRAGASANNIMLFFGSTANRVFIDFNNSSYADYRLSYDVSENTRYKAVISKARRAILAADGTVLAENTTACPDTITCPSAYLFAAAGTPAYNYGSPCKVYSCRINGKRNLVGAKDASNVVEMYDKVSNAPFTNAGTGAFTAGPNATPTPSAPMSMWCNNGELKYGKPVMLDATRFYAYISTSNTWSYSTDSYSIVVPVTVGKTYKITADPTTTVDGSIVNVILRWGFVDTVYDDWKQSTVVPASASVTIYDWVRSTPQDTQSVEVTATHPYMVVQMGAAAFASNLANGRIGVAVQEIYPSGTPETLTVTDADGNTQTATVQNLFAIPGTDYADTQEIINGPVGRKVLCLVLDGVTAGRKLSESWNATYKRGNLSVSGMLQSASSVADAMCTRFDYSASVYGAPTKDGFCTNSGVVFFTFIEDADVNSAADGNAKFAAWYAEGKPAMLFVPLAKETTEQTTAHSLHTAQGTNVVTAVTNVDPVTLTAEYKGVSA